jgi:hypothetical protein
MHALGIAVLGEAEMEVGVEPAVVRLAQFLERSEFDHGLPLAAKMASGVKGSSFRLVTAYGAIIVGRIEAGSIYYHFESREEILRAVLERGIGDARRDVMMAIEMAGPWSSPLVRLRAALGAHLKFALRHHFSSRLQPGFDPSVVRMLVMGALTWVAEWYDPKGPMSPDDIADELMRVLARGVVSPAGRSGTPWTN